MVFLLLSTLLNLSVFANTTFLTQIHDIDMGETLQDEVLVFFGNGKVGRLSYPDAKMLSDLKLAKFDKSWWEVTLDDERMLLTWEPSEAPIKPKRVLRSSLKAQEEDYIPTVIASMDLATQVMKEAYHHQKESQCYNRAHVWAYEWRKKSELYTSKAWLFFTRKYIRKYKFEWWFHVAPLFHVQDGNVVREKIADVKYANGRLWKLKQWTDFFLRNDAECPVVKEYSQWANYPESGSCFVMKSNMYYYQPVDLEAREKFGTERLMWIDTEVKAAYLEAFDITI